MFRDLWVTHRLAVIVAVAAGLVLLVAVVTLPLRDGTPARNSASQSAPSSLAAQTVAPGDSAGAGGGAEDAGPAGDEGTPMTPVEYDHSAWNAVPAVSPRTTSIYPPIPANLRTQPDTFASAFGTELLTRDYATSSRDDLLSWAQSEAASLTIRQVALTPTDRDKALIVSLTSPDWDGSPTTIVPSTSDWADLADLRGYTTVSNVKVEAVPDFPPADVSFTDQLTLARLYSATVTQHTVVGNTDVTSSRSVAFQIVLGTSLLHGTVFGAACTQNYVERGQS